MIFCALPVRRDRKIGAFTKISVEDYWRFAGTRWYLNDSGYAFGRLPSIVVADGDTLKRVPRKNILLSRAVLGLTVGDGMEADHINGDRLDNRRENLEAVTRAENLRRRNVRYGFRSKLEVAA